MSNEINYEEISDQILSGIDYDIYKEDCYEMDHELRDEIEHKLIMSFKPLISSKDQQIKRLTEALENAMVAFCNQVELDIIHPNHKHETESIADGIFKLLAEIKG